MAKSPPTKKSKFDGAKGKLNLLACISESKLLSGNTAAARALIAGAELVTHTAGTPLVVQGDSDDEVYFLVSGTIDILVNGRKIATREACTHVGEMSALDPTAIRSASVVAATQTTSLAINSKKFITTAEKYPNIYRRIAIEIAARLRQRNAFHKIPNSCPVIFIGSSSEGHTTAKRLSTALDSPTLSVRLWSQDVFSVSDTTIESLEKAAAEVDFAILVLTPDDITTSRRTRKPSPRDNVIYELGLFGGALGRKRTFMVVDASAKQKIPTDLLGVTALRFSGKNGITPTSLELVKRDVLAVVNTLGVR